MGHASLQTKRHCSGLSGCPVQNEEISADHSSTGPGLPLWPLAELALFHSYWWLDGNLYSRREMLISDAEQSYTRVSLNGLAQVQPWLPPACRPITCSSEKLINLTLEGFQGHDVNYLLSSGHRGSQSGLREYWRPQVISQVYKVPLKLRFLLKIKLSWIGKIPSFSAVG